MTVTNASIAPVRKTITVKAAAPHAFAVFTSGIDKWWPRSHHIGSAPLEEMVIEPGVGGCCYGRSRFICCRRCRLPVLLYWWRCSLRVAGWRSAVVSVRIRSD